MCLTQKSVVKQKQYAAYPEYWREGVQDDGRCSSPPCSLLLAAPCWLSTGCQLVATGCMMPTESQKLAHTRR
jgi:hypothetical protein